MESTADTQLLDLEYIAVRMERGLDVAVLLDSIAGIFWGDKGDILDAFVLKQLYVLRAKQSPLSIKMKRNPVFCKQDGTGCTALTLPIVYIQGEKEKTWHASNTLKRINPELFSKL